MVCVSLLLAVLLVLQLNARTVLLSLGALVLTLTYPLMKRLHQLPRGRDRGAHLRGLRG